MVPLSISKEPLEPIRCDRREDARDVPFLPSEGASQATAFDRFSICRTCTCVHRPPRGVATLRALSCPAIASICWHDRNCDDDPDGAGTSDHSRIADDTTLSGLQGLHTPGRCAADYSVDGDCGVFDGPRSFQAVARPKPIVTAINSAAAVALQK